MCVEEREREMERMKGRGKKGGMASDFWNCMRSRSSPSERRVRLDLPSLGWKTLGADRRIIPPQTRGPESTPAPDIWPPTNSTHQHLHIAGP